MKPHRMTKLLAAWTTTLFCAAAPAWAADLPADVQAKVDKAKKHLIQLAADPAVIAAVREANTHDAGGMTNGKWVDLADTDPAVKAIVNSKISLQIAKWEQADNAVNKLLLRDRKGNLIGASVRPVIFNNATRPVFANPIKGQAWSAGEIKPDTSTQIPSVHVAAPVLDAGEPIGVLQAGVTAN